MKDDVEELENDENLMSSSKTELILQPKDLERKESIDLISEEKVTKETVSFSNGEEGNTDTTIKIEQKESENSQIFGNISKQFATKSKVTPICKQHQDTGKSLATGRVISGWI